MILGSGAVGVEFASIFSRFGSKVTIVELLPRLVPVEDEAMSAELAAHVPEAGHHVLTGTKVTKRRGQGQRRSRCEAQLPGGKTQTLEADYLLVATGRGPVTEGLGVEKARRRDSKRLRQGGRAIIGPASRASRRSATSSRSAKARAIRSWRTSARRKGFSSPSASPARTCGRSTTTTCPAARTAIRRSAASA